MKNETKRKIKMIVFVLAAVVFFVIGVKALFHRIERYIANAKWNKQEEEYMNPARNRRSAILDHVEDYLDQRKEVYGYGTCRVECTLLQEGEEYGAEWVIELDEPLDEEKLLLLGNEICELARQMISSEDALLTRMPDITVKFDEYEDLDYFFAGGGTSEKEGAILHGE